MTLYIRIMYLPIEKYQLTNDNDYIHRQIILRNSVIRTRNTEWFNNNRFDIINNRIMSYNNKFKCNVIPHLIDLQE